MHRRMGIGFAVSVCVAACSADVAPPPQTSEISARTPDADNGQTGSIGAIGSECKEASDCLPRAESELTALARSTTSVHMFERGVCTQRNIILPTGNVNGPACGCKKADGREIMIGPLGLGCYARGRAGDCLWDDAEFSGCELDDTEQCSALCAKLEARFAADAARTFEGHVRHTLCELGLCHNVLEIEGSCYADRSYETGRSYSCELGDGEILEQHRAPKTPPTVQTAFTSPYVQEAIGFVRLSAVSSFVGTAHESSQFGAMAQFYTAGPGRAGTAQLIDPLEGLDDCGVSTGSVAGGAAPLRHAQVDRVRLIDGLRELPFELSSASSVNFFSYVLDLDALGVMPRFDADYGFRARGGELGEQVDVATFHLPQALSIRELETTGRVPHAPLRLSWTGSNAAPLRLVMTLKPTLGEAGKQYRVDCLMRDDGSFEIPASVFEHVANGFVWAEFKRETRALAQLGGKPVLTIAETGVTHRFALGERCERSAALKACLKYAEHVRARSAECSKLPPPSLESLCPEYLSEACAGCGEYFECMAENTSCTANGLTTPLGCSCPPAP